MDSCKHVMRLSLAPDHSILNPQRWHCSLCGTTESVWACLSCPHVACGRFIEEHALKHFKETKMSDINSLQFCFLSMLQHPLAIEVNDKFVYCYDCDDYVLNDNTAGDIKILRNCLRAVATQSFQDVPGRKHRLLRSYSYNPTYSLSYSDTQFRDDDQNYTALWFRRYYLLAKALTAWQRFATESKGVKVEVPLSESPCALSSATSSLSTSLSMQHSESGVPPARRKRFLTPGVTGLRNLGNTCYMNSILQVLRHLQLFRDLFFHARASVDPSGTQDVHSTPWDQSQSPSLRDIRKMQRAPRKHVSSGSKHASSATPSTSNISSSSSMLHHGRLVGGAEPASAKTRTRHHPGRESMLISKELHALLRVMWSGKWALVSPHKMLYAIWNLIPFFKGYSQQDAQEFLSEFLAKVQSEMEKMANKSESDKNGSHGSSGATAMVTVVQETKKLQDIITRMFQGELVSQVKCLRCGQVSQTYEPFMDLSLEFPDRYQVKTFPFTFAMDSSKVCVDPCHVEEMMKIFTDWEKLDGKIYACENCNKRRRRAASKVIYTEVKKRLMVRKLPHILRLHLKRFMWSGRNNRGKIGVQVTFDPELELKRFCDEELRAPSYLYELSAVVMHHGRGFGSGHYTSYCWNQEAGSWLHCNDAKMELCSIEDVRSAQAYILVYTRKDTKVDPSDMAVPLDAALTHRNQDKKTASNDKRSCIPKFKEVKRKLNQNEKGRQQLKRRKTTIW